MIYARNASAGSSDHFIGTSDRRKGACVLYRYLRNHGHVRLPIRFSKALHEVQSNPIPMIFDLFVAAVGSLFCFFLSTGRRGSADASCTLRMNEKERRATMFPFFYLSTAMACIETSSTRSLCHQFLSDLLMPCSIYDRLVF